MREQMRIAWTEDDAMTPGADHGVDFFSDSSKGSAELIAVLRGFDWLHGDPDVVEVRIRSAGTVDAAHLVTTRSLIEAYVRRGKAVHGPLAPSLSAHING